MPCLQPGLVPMFLWLLLLILAPGGEQSQVPPKAVLLLDPPWSTVFKGEKMILICVNYQLQSQEGTSWYWDDELIDETSGRILIETSGYYQCKTQGSSQSDPVHVEFSSDWLILQVPYPVFEGDDIDLRCQGRKEETIHKKIYYKDGKQLPDGDNSDFIRLHSVHQDKSKYHCAVSKKFSWDSFWKETSKSLSIQVQELFPHPGLKASPSQPIEGGPWTLTCETQLAFQRSHVQLQFCFFRDGRTLGSGCSSSPELQIPTMWREDSGFYWCKAEAATPRITKMSRVSRMRVQRIPVSDVNLEIQPPGGQLIEGENLVLICSVAAGTGNITFSWHKEGISLGRKTQHSLLAELRVPAVQKRDTGRYYCAADNNHVPILSQRITVTVRSLVSRPVLTLRAPRAQAVVGDVVELHCEALRGSPPILYQFYHEDVTLGNSSAPSGGGASFNLSLTAERSGNYSCEADNGLGAQRSHGVSLYVLVPVSHPVLTFRIPRAQAVVGDMVGLHCEALRGSPPILYQFYHENVILGNILAPSGGGASFNLSLTAEHSGNYSCDANNGLGAQRSEVVALSITGNSRRRIVLMTTGVTGGLLLILVFAATWLYRIKSQKKPGRLPATGTPSYSPSEYQETSEFGPSSIDSQEPPYSEQLVHLELQPVYSNVNPEERNLIYSQIRSIPNTNGISANSPRTTRNSKEPVVIYSELKKAHPEDSVGPASRRGSDHEDMTENYENVSWAPAALEH
ncbi:Fc receptor-like protein 3 [Marmota marmota marmota]|uniref:Fc receptor-like protein 3 n=1 Tax=Marmota marmota marmota TaxID=9994 RepID=UPI002093E035|nr:Fc receptor-like protein 3 [Marmota marmota marmota]